jgi:competence protein ComGC
MEFGPLTADQVRQQIQSGNAFARTMIRCEEETNWQQLSELPDFGEALRLAPSQAPAAPIKPPIFPGAPGAPNRCRLATASKTLLLAGSLAIIVMVLLVIVAVISDNEFLVILALLDLAMVPLLLLAAIVCGHVAKARIKKSGGALAGIESANTGLLGGYAVLSVVTILLLIAIPNFIKARTTASKNACPNNLRQLDGAKEQWALENKKTQTDTPTWDDLIGSDKYIKVMPTCPANGTYTLGNMITKPRCTIPDHNIE